MNSNEFLEFHKQFCNKMYEICKKKNQDYASLKNPFSNFEKAELMGICTIEAGILIRMIDKISRITNYVNKGQLAVTDETVADTLLDLANYSCMLAAYLKMKKELNELNETKDLLSKVDEVNELNELDKYILKYFPGVCTIKELVEHWFDLKEEEDVIKSIKKLVKLNKLKETNDLISRII